MHWKTFWHTLECPYCNNTIIITNKNKLSKNTIHEIESWMSNDKARIYKPKENKNELYNQNRLGFFNTL